MRSPSLLSMMNIEAFLCNLNNATYMAILVPELACLLTLKSFPKFYHYSDQGASQAFNFKLLCHVKLLYISTSDHIPWHACIYYISHPLP